jgi:hypothetical protein
MNNLPDIILKDVQDIYVRENFFRLDKFLKKYPLFRAELYFFELTFVAAVTNERRPHGLTFKPLDIIQTSLIGSGSLTWNYDRFDLKNLDVTTTGPCTVRAFIGAYRED